MKPLKPSVVATSITPVTAEVKAKNQNHLARGAYLKTELLQLMTTSPQKVISWNGYAELNQLSQENLNFLKTKFGQWVSESSLVSMASTPQFRYLRKLPQQKTVAGFPVLHDGGLGEESSFYSQIFDRSHSVGFKIMLTSENEGSFDLNPRRPTFVAHLDRSFARENGYVVPFFSNGKSLISFFWKFEPEALSAFLSENKFFLPANIVTVEQMIKLFESYDASDMAHLRYASLRRSLHKYILTPKDFEELMTWAQGEHKNLNMLQAEFPFELRIPYGVSPANYQYLRDENHMISPLRKITGKINHESMP